MKQQFIIIRGIPGTGKSTLVKLICSNDTSFIHCEADQYFGLFNDGKFDASLLSNAHSWCKHKTFSGLSFNKSVIVSNTFTTIQELKPYFEIAKGFDIVPAVYTCQTHYGSIHNVPQETIDKMKNRFVYDISSLYDKVQ